MKTPKCRNCDGKGNVHIDIPASLNKVFDIPCWICGASGFKGMNRDQVKWYLLAIKDFNRMKDKSLQANEIVAPSSWMVLKNAINKACGKVGIKTPQIATVKPTQWGETHDSVNMRVELKEFERRLHMIPMAIAAKTI